MKQAPPHAQGGVEIVVAPGDLDRRCPACNTGQRAGHDGDPRHVVLGARTETQQATLANGQVVPIQVPVDEAFHLDCHQALGCDHCGEVLDAHDGSVKGKAHVENGLPNVPDHLVSIAPGEFESGANGTLVRALSKDEAISQYQAETSDAGFDVVPHEDADILHAEHSAGTLSAKAV